MKGYKLDEKIEELLKKYGSLEKVVMIIGKPCYISFESALFEYGIKSRGPIGYQCATLSDEFFCYIRETPVEFIKIPEDYFFGYKQKNGIFWAEPEKALLDYVYYCELEGIKPDLYDIDWSELNRAKLEKYAKLMDTKLNFPDVKALRKEKHPKYHLLADELEEFLNK
jgi:hypothetical protein